MDEALRSLEQACLREPGDVALRERFARACVRAEEPVLCDDLELGALLFEGLSIAVPPSRAPKSATDAALTLIDDLAEARGSFFIREPESIGAIGSLALELIRGRLADPQRQSPAAYERVVEHRYTPFALHGVAPHLAPFLARLLARGREPEPWQADFQSLLVGLGQVMTTLFDDGPDGWLFRLAAIDPPVEAPALHPFSVPELASCHMFEDVDQAADPLAPFTAALFTRLFPGGWSHHLGPGDREQRCVLDVSTRIRSERGWFLFENVYA